MYVFDIRSLIDTRYVLITVIGRNLKYVQYRDVPVRQAIKAKANRLLFLQAFKQCSCLAYIATMKLSNLALASLLAVVSVYAAPSLNASPTVNPAPTTTCDFQPPTNSDPTQWSSDTYIEQHMIIPPSTTPIFWMGRDPNTQKSVLLLAENCALANDGVTIGMVMCENGFVGPPPPSATQSPEAERWNHLVSHYFAHYATGVAWTIAGNFTSTSDYLIDEFPELAKNPNVAVLGIDPYTCEPFCYWSCPAGTPDMDCKVRNLFPRCDSSIELTNFNRLSLPITSFATAWAIGLPHLRPLLLHSNIRLSRSG